MKTSFTSMRNVILGLDLLFLAIFLSAFSSFVPSTNGHLYHLEAYHRHDRYQERLYTGVSNFGSASDVKTFWFNQKLNHFDPSDTRQWPQRYFINDTFYRPGGPVFLRISGEEEANPSWMKYGEWIEFAQKLGAYCIQIEHRYYGQSHPTPDVSLSSLRYLTIDQALADLATFTAAMKLEKFPTNKWVVFGGSYAGGQAARYRLKYPHLVDIAVASSAPLVTQYILREYLVVVLDVIHNTNPTCLNVIKEAVQTMEQLLGRGPAGWEVLTKTFQLCDPLNENNLDDVSSLFGNLVGNWELIVQYNRDNREFEGSKLWNVTVRTLCDIMTENSATLGATTAMKRYAEVNGLFLRAMNESCTGINSSQSIHDYRQTDWNSSVVTSGARQWGHQTCTEFGYFADSNLKGQPFGNFAPQSSTTWCQEVFGPKYDQNFIENAIKWTNINYGGKSIKVSRVIFINGSNDPWHVPGITAQNQTTSDNLVIFIHGTAHVADEYPSSDKDPPQLQHARAQIFQQITIWLQK